VELDPKSVASGHDPQLERAVSIALDELKKNPPPQAHQPPYPDYQHGSTITGAGASKTIR
jgi:tricorn protease